MVTNILEIGKMTAGMVMDSICMLVGTGTRDSMLWAKRLDRIEIACDMIWLYRKDLVSSGGLKDPMPATST